MTHDYRIYHLTNSHHAVDASWKITTGKTDYIGRYIALHWDLGITVLCTKYPFARFFGPIREKVQN